MNMHIPSRQNIFREMRDYLMIALGMIMYGIGWTVFLLPNDITTGGVLGIASLVYFAPPEGNGEHSLTNKQI